MLLMFKKWLRKLTLVRDITFVVPMISILTHNCEIAVLDRDTYFLKNFNTFSTNIFHSQCVLYDSILNVTRSRSSLKTHNY